VTHLGVPIMIAFVPPPGLRRLLPVLFFLPATALMAGPSFSLSEKGPVIEAGSMGRFVMEPPPFSGKSGSERPVFSLKDTNTGIAKYPSGLELAYTVSSGQLKLHYSGAPAGGKGFKFQTMLPVRLNQGGTFAFDTNPAIPFPAEKGGQFVGKGNAMNLTVTDPLGEGFTLATPGGYHEMQDNRVFNWQAFGHHYYFDVFGKSEGDFAFVVKPAGSGVTAAPSAGKFLVDRFGQSARKDFPGKVTAEKELAADGAAQEAAKGAPAPNLDQYGGLAASGKEFGFKSTGFFHVESLKDRKVLVDPEGNLFFQLGVCGIASTDDFTTVKGRENVYEWLPDKGDETYRSAWRDQRPDYGIFSFYIANWIRKFGRPFTLEEWTAQVVPRLRSWGFNSAGAFSLNTGAMKAANFPNVSFLPLGKGDGTEVLPDKIGAAELLDPFVPGTEEALNRRFEQKIAPRANDPLLIGYFLGNEQHFEILPKLIPTYKASKVAAKGRLVSLLEDKYKDVAKFNAAWQPATPFTSFEDLKEQPLFVKTEAAAADVKEFYLLYLETYYSMVERVFRKHDPNHLLIGSRWTPNTANNQEVVEIGSKHLDVISINYYTDAIEEAFLKQVNQWSGGKPMIFSEWYFSTTGRGLGAGRQVKTEKERGDAYRNYVEQAAAFPSVVGSQWFIYTDQAITGRFFEGFHGEGNNTGLVDVTDRPYPELVEAAKTTHARIYDVLLGRQAAFAIDDPRFNGKGNRNSNRTVQIPRALPGMKLDGTTSNWPGRPAEPLDSSRAMQGLANPKLSGSFRLCWDDANLYFHIQVKDPTPLKTNKEGDKLWAADAIELFLGARELTKGGGLLFSDRQILIGAATEKKMHIVDHPDDAAACQVIVVKDVTGDGYVLQAALPWKSLGIEPKAGEEMLFDVAIDNSDDGDTRVQQLVWNGSAKNSGDRGSWGRARLSDN